MSAAPKPKPKAKATSSTSSARASADAGAAPVERTPDGHHIVVGGRRWRATDPGIPEPFRQELVAELMDARRSVAAAGRAGDPAVRAEARRRVQWAKVALGERGEPWWEAPTAAGDHERLAAILRTLAGHRAPDRTICPSDVARARGGEAWRARMDPVREIARALAREGVVTITQKGEPLDPDQTWHGPIRIRMGPSPR